MISKKTIFGLLVASVAGFALIGVSCSEKAEQVSAEEVAMQMEAAKEGREAAKEIITRNWKDTMQLQLAILDARAKNSRYEIEGKMKCKEKFDSAFFSTIRTVRPDLADQLQP